ncbi:MAG: hypothetical protein AMS18_02285 [Gemmatimonas sp. SG8_17]|nr:MAG: hypothetical protein AMS18_02285 [Gemmatimonas sp. SG8_17]
MSRTRREFIKQSTLSAVALGAAGGGWLPTFGFTPQGTVQGAAFKDLCLVALNAARSKRATYADVRIVNKRNQFVATQEERVSELQDRETFGVGVRALVNGAWGFAASRTVTRDECSRVALRAVEQAEVNSRAIRRPVELATVSAYPDGRWMTPIRRDPFTVRMSDKTELLLEANRAAAAVSAARFVASSMYFVKVETTFASTDGSIIEQTLYRSYPAMTVTAVGTDSDDVASHESTDIAPMGLGYEHVEAADLPGRATEWAELAVEMLSATSVEPGRYDLIIDPTNLFLTIHETIGRPTELDRALGYEADYAGTSFLAPPETAIGEVRYGPEFMNVIGDRTQRGGLATVGWDDEGVTADSWPIIQDGTFVDYQTTREQATLIAELTGITRSHGCSFGESWDVAQLQRMPNVSLLPGENEVTLDDLVAATDRGILIKGCGPYSIDQRQYNFQFGGHVCYEVRGGRITRMLKDVAYQGNTLEFWNSLDMLGGPRSYELCGTIGDTKGQPTQLNAASHGCPAARFHDCRVINTAA